MFDIDEFLDDTIKHKHDDNFNWDIYYRKISRITRQPDRIRKVIDYYREHFHNFNKSNALKALGVISDIFEENVIITEFYPILLYMMFRDYSVDASIPYKYIRLLLKIEPNKAIVFRDILLNMDVNNPNSITIGVLSLYSDIGDFSSYTEEILQEYLFKVSECYQHNKGNDYLARSIFYDILPRINHDKYMRYRNIFKDIKY